MTASCGGSEGDADGDAGTPSSISGPETTIDFPFEPPRLPPTTAPPPEGVETFPVTAGHAGPDETVTYAQTPPVGGIHNPSWQRCGFYDSPVPSERAVHSLEHGAIWITYRPDIPAEEKEALARLAGSRRGILVSRWDEGLPSPVVASSWGRQLKLQSVSDPRLMQFILAFSGDAPEPNGPCT